MKTLNNLISLNDLSQKHSTWIIKYCSATFGSPLFLVWYTDTHENRTDRLLTYKNGKIFATKSLSALKTTLLSEINHLVVFDNLTPWLANFKDNEVVEYCTYDFNSVISNLDKNNLDIPTMEGLAGFINLYGDYVQQDKRNTHLRVHIENEFIKETWNYFYNNIF